MISLSVSIIFITIFHKEMIKEKGQEMKLKREQEKKESITIPQDNNDCLVLRGEREGNKKMRYTLTTSL